MFGATQLGRMVLGLAALALASVAAAPAWAETWLRVESPHFIVYGDAPEPQMRKYALMLEDFDAVLRTFHGRKPDEAAPRKLAVYTVGSGPDLRRIYHKASTTTLGFYFTGPTDVFAAARRSSSVNNDQNLLHEYVHHFMMQYYPNAYPGWLVEGYAEYFMTADLGAEITIGKSNLQRTEGLAAAGTSWVPMRDLLSKRPAEIPADLRSNYYAQAWLLTHYIMSDVGRRRSLNAYLAATNAGVEHAKAWTEAFGSPPERLGDTLKKYMGERLAGRVFARTWQAPALTVSALSPGAGEVILERQALMFDVDDGLDGERILKTVRAAHQTFAQDPDVILTLGIAETKYGDRARGETLLKGLIDAEGDNSAALLALASSKLVMGEKDEKARTALYREAGGLLAEAVKVEPDSYQILSRYAETRTVEPDFPSANTLNTLIKAVSLAPQVSELRLQAADAALARKNPELARGLLKPVINSPHGGETVEAARQLMIRVDATPPPPATP